MVGIFFLRFHKGNMKQSKYDKTLGGLAGGCQCPSTGILGSWYTTCHLVAHCGGLGLTLSPPLQAMLKTFSAKIVQLLKEWTEAFPCDFQDEKAMAELKAITHRVMQCDEVRSSLNSGGAPLCGREESLEAALNVIPFPDTPP